MITSRYDNLGNEACAGHFPHLFVHVTELPGHGHRARICWVRLGDRHRSGPTFNEMVRFGELSVFLDTADGANRI